MFDSLPSSEEFIQIDVRAGYVGESSVTTLGPYVSICS